MIHELIYSLLTTVTAKVFPGIVPEGTVLPYIRHFQVGSIPSPDTDGSSKLDKITWQISCFAGTYSDVKDMSDDVRDALDEYADLFIERISFIDESYIQEGVNVHHMALDFRITQRR